MPKALLVNQSAVKSGGMIEVWIYSEPIAIRLEKQTRVIGNFLLKATKDDIDRVKKKNALESYNSFLRLVVANFGNNRAKFITLTFEDTTEFDITDVEKCNHVFQLFIKRLRGAYGNKFRYLVTIEFQDKNNRNAVHYHMIADLPYIKNNEFNKIWGLGYTQIRSVKNSKQSAVYVGKYMRKGLIDDRLNGKKKYWGSKNLLRPKELYNNNVNRLLDAFPGKEKYSENCYFSEYHHGYITYAKYFIDDDSLTYDYYNIKTSCF